MVSQRCLGIAGVGLMTLLCLPRESAAGIGDIIFGMSGPQMIGAIAHCRVPFGGSVTQCHILNKGRTADADDLPFWVSLEGGFYVSTTRDAKDGHEFDWFDVRMVTFEPLFEWRWPSHPRIRHGIGLGYNFLFGDGFDAFDKFNVKLRLIDVEFPGFDLAFNLRLYPNGVTSNEFSPGPKIDVDRPAEVVIGASVGFGKLSLW
jgi:hypothetical protein